MLMFVLAIRVRVLRGARHIVFRMGMRVDISSTSTMRLATVMMIMIIDAVGMRMGNRGGALVFRVSMGIRMK